MSKKNKRIPKIGDKIKIIDTSKYPFAKIGKIGRIISTINECGCYEIKFKKVFTFLSPDDFKILKRKSKKIKALKKENTGLRHQMYQLQSDFYNYIRHQ